MLALAAVCTGDDVSLSTITVGFGSLSVLACTQDIAVDSWGLQLPATYVTDAKHTRFTYLTSRKEYLITYVVFEKGRTGSGREPAWSRIRCMILLPNVLFMAAYSAFTLATCVATSLRGA